jgi:Rps23 Pro-64 3,4-dihydroxylase Tpa1-like proline 4-hydroxylase
MSDVQLRADPFAHTSASNLLAESLADRTLSWMETDAPWRLRIASFYEQWELALDAEYLPPELRELIAPRTIIRLVDTMLQPITDCKLELREVTAHKLLAGQTIRIHNDFIDGEETHRLIVQLNRGWDDRKGGLLMLFGSARVEDVRRAVRPLHGSAFAFEISPRSFHAVSTIKDGERYTLVYSFKSQKTQ